MSNRLFLGAAGVCAGVVLLGQLGALTSPAAIATTGGEQPDVLLGETRSVEHWGAVDGIHGYTIGSETCNIGTTNLLWGRNNDGTPTLGMNIYRLENGRIVQIGMSFAKHATRAIVGNGCGMECNGDGDDVLGVGCRDVYDAAFNGFQTRLGPRSVVNAWTGELQEYEAAVGDAIFRRIQVAEADIDMAAHPDALYFVEGVYVGKDDAGVFGNAGNNASYKRAVVGAGFEISVRERMDAGVPAIFAWHDHGGGVGIPDPEVEVNAVDVPGEGRYFVGSKVIDVGNGTWRYEYAVFNLSSDRSARGLTVRTGLGVDVTDIGFRDVDYHSGERYDNTDWVASVEPTRVTWSSRQSFDDNPDANALRWGVMYSFWFTANAPPADKTGWIEIFKPGIPDQVSFGIPAPDGCGADLDGDDRVGFADLLRILTAWGPCDECPEDLDQSGRVDFTDLLRILAAWGPCD